MKQTLSLATPFDFLDKKLQLFFENRFWKIRLILLALFISAGSLLLFNFIFVDVGLRSLYQEMRHPGSVGGLFWDDIILQGEDPFTPKHYEAGTHEANQTFRLTIPFIARFLHLNVATLYLLHVLVGLAFIWVVTSVVANILENKVLTFYFVTGFTAIYAGANFYINWFGHADAFPFLFMALVLFLRKPVWVLIFSQLAFWCDERALINSTFIGLWFLIPLLDNLFTNKKLDFKLIPAAVYTLVISGIIYVALRKWMEISLGLSIGHDSSLSEKTVMWSLSIFGDKITRGLEGMWLILFGALAILVLSKQWIKFTLFSGSLLITVIIMLMVADGTRALSYGFVAFFIALKILHDQISTKQLRYLLILSALISLMLPLSFP